MTSFCEEDGEEELLPVFLLLGSGEEMTLCLSPSEDDFNFVKRSLFATYALVGEKQGADILPHGEPRLDRGALRV